MLNMRSIWAHDLPSTRAVLFALVFLKVFVASRGPVVFLGYAKACGERLRSLSNIFNIIILSNSKTFLLVFGTLHYTTFWWLSAQDGTTWTAVNPLNISAVPACARLDRPILTGPPLRWAVCLSDQSWMYSCTTQFNHVVPFCQTHQHPAAATHM